MDMVITLALYVLCACCGYLAGCHNLAHRISQKRGFDMSRLFCNAVDLSRKLKPEIPLFGIDAIPLKHEIELEMNL